MAAEVYLVDPDVDAPAPLAQGLDAGVLFSPRVRRSGCSRITIAFSGIKRLEQKMPKRKKPGELWDGSGRDQLAFNRPIRDLRGRQSFWYLTCAAQDRLPQPSIFLLALHLAGPQPAEFLAPPAVGDCVTPMDGTASP